MERESEATIEQEIAQLKAEHDELNMEMHRLLDKEDKLIQEGGSEMDCEQLMELMAQEEKVRTSQRKVEEKLLGLWKVKYHHG